MKYSLLMLLLLALLNRTALSAEQLPAPTKAPSGQMAIQVAKEVKELMKDFYQNNATSEFDLQKKIVDRGFSHLKVDCEEGATIVDLADAPQIIEIYLSNLKDLLPAKLYNHAAKFISNWSKIKMNKFTKKEILFSEKGESAASFLGIYQKRTKKELYIAYNFSKNSFKLAPDIYVVRKTESDSALWGAISTHQSRDVLQEVTRGFNIADLNCLLDITSVSVIDLDMLAEMEE